LTRKKTKSKAKAKTKSSADWTGRLVRAVWPQERDFFERPERFRYVRKLLPETGKCVFCEALKAGVNADSLLLARDARAMVVMNKYPYNTGHLLVLPTEHVGELTEISDDVNNSVMKWIKTATGILREEMKCAGFNMGLNLGAVAGAGIPGHLHWHIVPRWGGDTNFFPLIGETKAIPEAIEQTYGRLLPHFKSAGAVGGTGKKGSNETDF